MKLHHALPLLAMASAEQQQQQQHHRRRLDRLTYQSLASPNQQLLDALSQDGIVSITGIPNFKETKRNLMTHLHACLMDMEDDPDAVVPTTQYLRDGTVRRSIATATLPSSSSSGVSSSGGTMVPQPLHGSIPETTSCTAFKQHADSFRAGVDMATDAFAERLSLEMGPSLHSPVMSNEDGSKAFDTIHQLVEGGEHLEHFHSYQKKNNNNNKSSSSSSGSSAGNLRGEEEEGTISLHTDQGFFIAFTPGLIVSHNKSNGTKRSPDLSKGVEMSDGFYVEDAEGHRSLLQFEDEDDLVFMMGDGANQ